MRPKKIYVDFSNVPPCNFGALWYEEPVEGAVEYVLADEYRWIPVSERLPELKNHESSEMCSCPENMTVVIAKYADGDVFPAYVYYSGMYVGGDDEAWIDFEPAEELIYNETVFFSDLREVSGDNVCEVTHWMPLPSFSESEKQ